MRTSESRKRAAEHDAAMLSEAEHTWPALALVEDVRLSAAEVWHGAEWVDAEALLDQLETRGLKVVRA